MIDEKDIASLLGDAASSVPVTYSGLEPEDFPQSSVNILHGRIPPQHLIECLGFHCGNIVGDYHGVRDYSHCHAIAAPAADRDPCGTCPGLCCDLENNPLIMFRVNILVLNNQCGPF